MVSFPDTFNPLTCPFVSLGAVSNDVFAPLKLLRLCPLNILMLHQDPKSPRIERYVNVVHRVHAARKAFAVSSPPPEEQAPLALAPSPSARVSFAPFYWRALDREDTGHERQANQVHHHLGDSLHPLGLPLLVTITIATARWSHHKPLPSPKWTPPVCRSDGETSVPRECFGFTFTAREAPIAQVFMPVLVVCSFR
mgnify:CR=1 FL=1